MHNPADSSPDLALELLLPSDRLAVLLFNRSSQEVRIWELENSWGWYSFSFELKRESDPDAHRIVRKPRDWTKNGPTFQTLPPGSSREIAFCIDDGWWEVSEDLKRLQDEPILIRCRYEVGPSQEAEEYCVFVGTVSSNWFVSLPPHTWLEVEERGR